MKVSVVQPPYSMDNKNIDLCHKKLLELLDQCDESMDIIVLPEYSDVSAKTDNDGQFYDAILKYNRELKEKVIATAKKNNAIIFANFSDKTPKGYRNTTFAINRQGEIVGKYYKAHPAPSEVNMGKALGCSFDVSYSYEYRKPYTVEIEGIRFGFLTCYDFYMYENYAKIARENVDIIIGCSYQRSDTHNALDIFGRFLSYQTNSYLIRSSISLGEDSELCGCSMVVTPKGEKILDMKNDIGIGSVIINPKYKYFKPAGFGGKEKAHYEYIDAGRRPWLYRNGGSMMVPNDIFMKYPRICASFDGGNLMAQIGSAVGVDVNEISLKLTVKENTIMAENEVEFTKVLQKFSGMCVMNLDISELEESYFEEIFCLAKEYDCEHHIYVTSKTKEKLTNIKKIYKNINCSIISDNIEDAINVGATKIELSKYDEETITKAHQNNIRCITRNGNEKGFDTVITKNFIK